VLRSHRGGHPRRAGEPPAGCHPRPPHRGPTPHGGGTGGAGCPPRPHQRSRSTSSPPAEPAPPARPLSKALVHPAAPGSVPRGHLQGGDRAGPHHGPGPPPDHVQPAHGRRTGGTHPHVGGALPRHPDRGHSRQLRDGAPVPPDLHLDPAHPEPGPLERRTAPAHRPPPATGGREAQRLPAAIAGAAPERELTGLGVDPLQPWILGQFLDEVPDAHQLAEFGAVAAGEKEAALLVALHGVRQAVGDAVAHCHGALAVAAGGEAVADAANLGRGAGLDVPLQAGAHTARGQAHGGLHETDVLGFRAEDDLFEDGRGVAFEGADEAGAHLHAIGAQGQEALDVRVIPDTARHQHGEAAPLVPLLDHLGEDVFQSMGGIQATIVAKALVAPALGAFQHHGVRQAVVFPLPLLADHLERPSRGHDGHQGHIRIPHEAGQGQREAGPGHDHLGAARDRSPDRGFIAFDGAEDVDAHGATALGALPRRADDPFQCLGRIQRIRAVGTAQTHGRVGRTVVAGADGRHQAHAAGAGHGPCQALPGDAHPHAALLDGVGQVKIADAQARQGAGPAAYEGLGHGVQTGHEAASEGGQGRGIEESGRAGLQADGAISHGLPRLGFGIGHGHHGQAQAAKRGHVPGMGEQGRGPPGLGPGPFFGPLYGDEAGHVGMAEDGEGGWQLGGVQQERHPGLPCGGHDAVSAVPQSPQVEPDLGAFAHGGLEFLEALPQLGGIGEGVRPGQRPTTGPQEGRLEIQRARGLPTLEGGCRCGLEKGLSHALLRGAEELIHTRNHSEAKYTVTVRELLTRGQQALAPSRLFTYFFVAGSAVSTGSRKGIMRRNSRPTFSRGWL